jgi:hypothetical protein
MCVGYIQIPWPFCFILFFVVEIDPRASHMLSRYFTSELQPDSHLGHLNKGLEYPRILVSCVWVHMLPFPLYQLYVGKLLTLAITHLLNKSQANIYFLESSWAQKWVDLCKALSLTMTLGSQWVLCNSDQFWEKVIRSTQSAGLVHYFCASRSTGNHKVAWQTWNKNKAARKKCVPNSTQRRQPDFIMILPKELETLKTHWLNSRLAELVLSWQPRFPIATLLQQQFQDWPIPLQRLKHPVSFGWLDSLCSVLTCVVFTVFVPWENSLCLEGNMEKWQ